MNRKSGIKKNKKIRSITKKTKLYFLFIPDTILSPALFILNFLLPTLFYFITSSIHYFCSKAHQILPNMSLANRSTALLLRPLCIGPLTRSLRLLPATRKIILSSHFSTCTYRNHNMKLVYNHQCGILPWCFRNELHVGLTGRSGILRFVHTDKNGTFIGPEYGMPDMPKLPQRIRQQSKKDDAGKKQTAKSPLATSLVMAKTGKWQTLKNKVRWMLFRQSRSFNADDISAFVSWIMMGNLFWIFIGTTTFVGLLIYLGNMFVGGDINKRIVQQLVTFDNNMEIDVSNPRFKATWENGTLRFRNIKVKSKQSNEIDYTFDIDTVNLTLSLNKWLDGHGLIKGIDISGLEGTVTFPQSDQLSDSSFADTYVFDSFKMSDSRIKMEGKNFKEPFELDLFTCEMGRLRRTWLMYDFLNADALSGSLNGSLFTLHKRQNRYAHFAGMDDDDDAEANGTSPWKKISRIRVDQVDLSKIFTENSKVNWLTSGKAELIVDIMLPTDDGSLEIAVSDRGLVQGVREEMRKLYSSGEEREKAKQNIGSFVKSRFEALKSAFGKHKAEDKEAKESTAEKGKAEDVVFEDESAVKSLNATVDSLASKSAEKKYVVMDFKINLYDLKAATPETIPASSLTGAPYISEKDMNSLVTFINDKKYGLSSGSSSFNDGNSSKTDNPDLDDQTTGNGDNGADAKDADISPFDEENPIPPLKFRIVQNVNNFQFIDFPTLIALANQKRTTNGNSQIAFEHTHQLMDSLVSEALSLLLLYKEEMRMYLMRKYSQRSGMQIVFNNSALGNLLLVGLGSFAI